MASGTTPDVSLEEFRDEARTWLGARELPRLAGRFETDLPVLRQWQRDLYEGGWMGISWPVQYGGRGLTLRHQAVFNQELVLQHGPIPAGQPGIDVAGPTIIMYGTDEQRAELLKPLLRGDDMWCLGMSEPEAGSDLAAVRTRAEADGDVFRLNGQKIWTTFAKHCSWCLVLARTDQSASKHRGISFFLVPLDLPGISTRTIVDLAGDVEFCEVFFDDVAVPANLLLGELNRGWEYARNSLGLERGPLMVRSQAELSVGFAELNRALASSGCSESEQESLGEVRVLLDTLEGQAARMMARMEAETGAAAEDSADKLMTSRLDQALYHVALEMLGRSRTIPSVQSRGLDGTRWLPRYMYSRASSIFAGTDQIQRNILARHKLGLPDR